MIRDRVHLDHWIVWWLDAGLILALVGGVNVLERHLTHTQEGFTAAFLFMFWLLSGVVCYGVDSSHR